MDDAHGELHARYIVLLSSVVGAACGTLTGFGITLSFLMVYSLARPIFEPLPAHLVPWAFNTVGLLTCFLVALENRRHIPVRWVITLVLPTIVVSPAGTLASLALETGSLMLLFSAFFFLIASQQLCAEWRRWQGNEGNDESSSTGCKGDGEELPRNPYESVELVCVGAASGFLGGLCGLGGPPINIYVVARPLQQDPVRLRAGVGAYFTYIYASNLATLCMAQSALLGTSALTETLTAASLGVVVGKVLAALLLTRVGPLDSRAFNTVIIGLLFATCASIWADTIEGIILGDAGAEVSPHDTPQASSTMANFSGTALRLGLLAGIGGWVALLWMLFVVCHGEIPASKPASLV
jgi:uncharacterized membrane protein YfcA